MSWFAHAVACSLYALGFGAYFRLVLSSVGVPEFRLGFMTLEKWLAVATCVLFSYINFRGAAETGKAGNVVTVGKVVVIGLFVAAGLFVMTNRPDWSAAFVPVFSHGWGGVFAAMGLTFIAFEGYEIIAQTSEEVEDPKRNVPRAVFLSLLIVVPIYLLVAFVAIGSVVPPAGLAVTDYLAREKELALVSSANQFVRGGGIVIWSAGCCRPLGAGLRPPDRPVRLRDRLRLDGRRLRALRGPGVGAGDTARLGGVLREAQGRGGLRKYDGEAVIVGLRF
jgi:amino acid transporter